ncbi:MAG: hypothetical protein K0R15_1628 [Clostridiales bacterium]|jgi:hypothetical protein|nr:hypothetical protein [Clostridiales bacterium]
MTNVAVEGVGTNNSIAESEDQFIKKSYEKNIKQMGGRLKCTILMN